MKKRVRAARRESVRVGLQGKGGAPIPPFDRGRFLRELADGVRMNRWQCASIDVMTQSELASVVGVSQPKIAALENGNALEEGHLPRIDFLYRVAWALGLRLRLVFEHPQLACDADDAPLVDFRFSAPEIGKSLPMDENDPPNDGKDDIRKVAMGLCKLRKSLGLTQTALAKKIGVSQPLIAKVEGCIEQSRPRFDILTATRHAMDSDKAKIRWRQDEKEYQQQLAKMKTGQRNL